jgi:hypothetical protein
MGQTNEGTHKMEHAHEMGAQMTNGQLQPGGTPTVYPPMTDATPLAYYQPFAITPSTIKWFGGMVCAIIVTLHGSGWLFMPAKQDDMTALTRIVQTLQQGQAETNKAVERLTVAVDNLSGIVDGVKQATKQVGKIKNAVGNIKLR